MVGHASSNNIDMQKKLARQSETQSVCTKSTFHHWVRHFPLHWFTFYLVRLLTQPTRKHFVKIGSTSVSIVFQYKVRHFSAVLVHPLCGVTPIRERNSRGKLPAPSQTRNKLMWLLTEQVLLTQSTLPCKQDSAARRP